MDVKKIMSCKIVTVDMDDSLCDIKKIFDNTRFHHLLVVDSGKLFGVISDRDMLKAISPNVGTIAETAKDAATLNKKAHQIMSRKLIVLKENANINDAIHIFNTHAVSCIPVIDADNKPIGIISWRDIFHLIEQKDTH